MAKSILELYVDRKADRYADRVNEEFGKTPNDIVQSTLNKYADPSKSGSDTPSHAKVTSRLMAVMVDAVNMKHPNTFTEKQKQSIVIASMLHDIGKTGVPVSILDKPGRPTPDEFDHIKTHTIIGNRIIGNWLRNENLDENQRQILIYAQEMACYHHERPDGNGYPLGLSCDEIPYSAKMMAVVDVMEALTAQRAYKDPMPFEKAESIIREGAGKQFDAELVEIFFSDEKTRSEINRIIEDGRVEKMNMQIAENEELNTDNHSNEITNFNIGEER